MTLSVNTFSIDGSNIVGYGSGSLISLDQTVRTHATGDGALVSLAQNTKSIGSGRIVTLTQLVKSNYQATFLERNGWYPIFTVNGYVIPDNKITGNISIQHTENDSSEMTFTMMVDAGVQDLGFYEGATVICDIALLSPNITKRAFTGIINIVDADLLYGKLTFTCSMQRREKILSDLTYIVPTIGQYSTDVFGTAQDLADEADKRLSTTPLALDFDSYGSYQIASLIPKSTADYTYTNGDIYRDDGRDVKIQRPVRTQIVNQIDIALTHQYTRCYHSQTAFNFPGLSNVALCDFLRNGYTVPTRDLIQSAVSAVGWPVRGAITYTAVPAGGFYNCNGSALGWTTTKTSGTYAVRKDVNGNPVLDTNGQPMYTFTQTGATDVAGALCFGASWQATTRWTQNVTETYTLSVKAPQSQAQYGVIKQTENVGVSSTYDAETWENYKSYQQEPSGVTTTPAQPAVSYFFNQDTNISGFNAAALVEINKAYTTILKSHRQHRITFNKFIDPLLELRHTVHLNTDIVNAKGKVYSINHSIDIDSGNAVTKVEMVLCKSSGSTSADVLSIPARPSDSPSVATVGVTLDAHWGQDPSTTAGLKWTGYIGNKWVTTSTSMYSANTALTTYPISFRVDAPAIPDVLRSNRSVTASQSYNIEIPNGTLTVTSK